MQSFILATLFAGAALAAPTPATPYPTDSQEVFSLVAKVTKQRTSGTPLNVDNYLLSDGHIGAGENVAFLTNQSTPQTWVQNGTTDQIMYGSGFVERYPPTPGNGYPGAWGIVVQPSGETDDAGKHYIGVDIGTGSQGAGIRFPYTGVVFPEDQPILGFTNQTVATYTSQFMVCDGQLYNENIPQVFWRSENGTTPAECAEIVFFAQCAGNATAENASYYNTIQKTPCYANASSIPYVGN